MTEALGTNKRVRTLFRPFLSTAQFFCYTVRARRISVSSKSPETYCSGAAQGTCWNFEFRARWLRARQRDSLPSSAAFWFKFEKTLASRDTKSPERRCFPTASATNFCCLRTPSTESILALRSERGRGLSLSLRPTLQ